MPAIPRKRLLVYAAAGLLVLGVGAAGLVAMRPAGGTETEGMVLDFSGEPALGESGDTSGAAIASSVPGLSAATSSSTTVTEAPLIYVQVAGAVRRPGVYQMPPETRVFQAVVQAGGFSADADEQVVPLAARLNDGCRLYVPRQGETVTGPVLTSQSSGSTQGAAAGPVSLNSATLDELDALPGIGPALAQQIISYRESKGPFTSVDQLADVPGIGPSKLEQLRPLVGL